MKKYIGIKNLLTGDISEKTEITSKSEEEVEEIGRYLLGCICSVTYDVVIFN